MFTTNPAHKKVFIALLVALLVGLSFVFRKEISQTLIFESGTTGGEMQFVQQFPKKEEKSGSVDAKPLDSQNIPATTVPVYTGRDPAEIKPAADAVQLFNEEQKQKIYNEIKNHAQAVRENNDYFFGWIQIGLLKKVIGDYIGARDAWEYAGVIRPANSVSFANLGELYWRYVPTYSKAEMNFKISIKNKPDDPSTYISLSDLYSYSYKEKADRADTVLLEGIAKNPKEIELPRALASLYGRMGEHAKALEWWQRVLEKEPDNQGVRQEVETLKKQLGK